MPTDAPASVPSSAAPVHARWLHNYRVLYAVTGVDPLRWPEADSVEGWHYEWWEVDFGEPGGPRLGVVDVLKRDNPERCLRPHAEAVAAIDSAWPTTAIVIRPRQRPRPWMPVAVRLPSSTAIGDHDDLEHDRHEFERAAAATSKCPTFLSDEPFTEWDGEFDVVAVGYDLNSHDDLAVTVTARPLHWEDSFGPLDWEFVRGPWPEVSWQPLGDEMFDRVCRLGPMVDEWCPIPQGDPAVARILGDAYDMLVEAPELDTDWLVHRLSLDPDGPSWWCRWCPQTRRRPAQYVTGGPDGTVSCATHLPNAAALERQLDEDSSESGPIQ